MTKFKYLPGDKKKDETLASIIRVDHAGEFGAKRIYQGQLSILKKDHEIGDMLKQELRHLDYFEKKIKEGKIRPTLLQPIWHIGGFAMGAITALMGRKAAMACTVAVEEIIEAHYKEQLQILDRYPEEKELVTNIKKFREEELEHRDIGMENKAGEIPTYSLLTKIIKCVTRTAISLSKRI